MRISAQLYTVRQIGDLRQQLELVSGCGYHDVELIGFHNLSCAEVCDQIAESGLRVRSVQFDWPEFESRLDEIVQMLVRLDCPVAVMPWLEPHERPDRASGWQDIARQLSDWANYLEPHGIALAYHNHDFDLDRSEGQMPLDVILSEPKILWQPDVGWVRGAGEDVVSMLQTYASKIVSIHAKDIDPKIEGRHKRWRDIGEGVLDWPAILTTLSKTRCRDLFVEHDESPDHQKTMQTGRDGLNLYLSEAGL